VTEEEDDDLELWSRRVRTRPIINRRKRHASAAALLSQLRVARRAQGLSVRQLAAAAGVNSMSLYRYESEDTQPSLGAVCLLADALGYELILRSKP